MAMQDTFGVTNAVGFNGQVSDINVAKIDSWVNTGATEIPVGVFVEGVSGGVNQADASTEPSAIAGLAVRNVGTENGVNSTAGYPVNSVVSVLRDGRAYVYVTGTAVSGTAVNVDTTGAVVGSGGTELNLCKFLQGGTDEVVEIEINAPINLTITTP